MIALTLPIPTIGRMVRLRALATLSVALLLATLASACSPKYKGVDPVIGPKDTAESILGERLFREPRFSKYFVRQSGGDPNGQLRQGDPALERLASPRRGDLSNPFARQAMSCAGCHMVDDARSLARGGMRGYADFAARSPIPSADGGAHAGLETTPRNSPILLGAFITSGGALTRPGGAPFLLHYDGEFTTTEDLIIGGFTGRNFGWLPGEKAEALANIARVVREDDGTNAQAARFSNRVAYRDVLTGRSPALPRGNLIAPEARMDVTRMGADADAEIVARVVSLVKTYLDALQFATDPASGAYNGSPFDEFLRVNRLPRQPDEGESPLEYAGRLAWAMQGLGRPQWVSTDAGEFGPKELEGARVFLATSKQASAAAPGFLQVGNCVACHAPPHFTDFKPHNTGATQEEYDSIHGAGKFAALAIPTLAERIAAPNDALPATDAHPQASSRFRSAPAAAFPGLTDLGAWNIFANPDFPAPQAALSQFFCPSPANGDAPACATDADREAALARAVATFKTPSLRGLALSDPYLHTGSKANLGEVMRFYREISALARQGRLRNADPEIARIDIDLRAAQSLEAFLNALNEEYE